MAAVQSSRVASRAAGDAIAASFKSGYICKSCRHQLIQHRLANHRQVRHASNEGLPFTEKLRRRIWGTDNPPGLKDPYGGPSFLEKRQQRIREERESRAGVTYAERRHEPDMEFEDAQSAAELMEEREPGQMEEYVPAERWDGLQHMGHRGDWRDLPPQPQDDFEP